MQVYVAYQQSGISGVYDSLIAVKQDFYDGADDWQQILDYNEEDYIEYLYQFNVYLSLEEVLHVRDSDSLTPLPASIIDKEIEICKFM